MPSHTPPFSGGASGALTDSGVYHDDIIVLAGQELVVRGPIRAGMISEFSTGIKIGKATYDEREHAFWIVLDDFSGGFGNRKLDIREAGGTHWDNPGGIDLRRPRHITLPPRRTTVNPVGNLDPGSAALFLGYPRSVYHTTLGPDLDGNIYIAILDAIYTLDSTRATLTRRYQQGGTSMRFGTVVESVDSAGVRFLLAAGSVGTGTHEYARSLNGTAWTASSGLPATPNASVQTSDMIAFDGFVIAHGEGDQIFGGVDGIAWLTDSAGVLDEHWRTGDIAVNFLGVSMAPWGEPVVYYLSRGKLWILDWYIYNAVEVEDVGDGNYLSVGCLWNGSIFVSDGWNVWEYNPGNAQTVRKIGLFGKDGPPTSVVDDTGHAGTPNSYTLQFFLPGTSDLFAACRSLTSPRSWRLAAYNGVGWSWFGPEVGGTAGNTSQPYGGLVDYFPTRVSLTMASRYIDIAALDDQSGTDFTMHTFELPVTGDIPIWGVGQDFADGPLRFETGWFDGGFAELEGALLRLSIDGYHLSASETVQVEYRLNNNEAAAWTDLGTFTMNQQEVWFNDAHTGIAFKTVQFRITLDRGGTTNRTPELSALILLFDKKPRIRTSWTLQIDVARTVERKISIQGEEATTERVWQFLKSVVNTPTLVKLEVPSLESGGVNVRITDMPGAFTDIRPARGGRGLIDLQCIEIAAE